LDEQALTLCSGLHLRLTVLLNTHPIRQEGGGHPCTLKYCFSINIYLHTSDPSFPNPLRSKEILSVTEFLSKLGQLNTERCRGLDVFERVHGRVCSSSSIA